MSDLIKRAGLNSIQAPAGPLTKKVQKAEAPQGEHSPKDGVSLGQNLTIKEPRPGSDMAQMVEDMRSNGVLPESIPEPPVSTTSERPKPREGSDMAEMLKNIETPMGQLELVATPNGVALAMMDEITSPTHSTSLDRSIEGATPEVTKEHHHGEAHGHGHGHSQAPNAHMGGHLGSEAVELKAHAAHHGHEVAHHGSHHAAEAVSHKVAHGAAETGAHVKNHALAETVEELTSPEIVTDTLQTAQNQSTGHGVHELAEAAGDHSSALGLGMEVALWGATAASGILAPIMIKHGAKELAHGLSARKEAKAEVKAAQAELKQAQGGEAAGLAEQKLEKAQKAQAAATDQILEGVGSSVVGGRSAVAGLVTAGMATGTHIVGPVLSKVLLTSTGVVHGGIDIALGARNVARGETTKGVLEMGFGSAVIATAAFGAGLPGVAVAGAFLIGKIAHGVISKRKAKKAAAAQQAEQQQAQQPKQLPTASETSVAKETR